MRTILKRTLGILLIAGLLTAQPTSRSVGTKQLPDGLQVVPATLTSVVSKDAWIYQIVVANITGSAVTFLVQDKQGTPLAVVPTVSIPANTAIIITFPFATRLIGGFSWQAGTGSALNAEILAYSL
jgi:hypothetical protein